MRYRYGNGTVCGRYQVGSQSRAEGSGMCGSASGRYVVGTCSGSGNGNGTHADGATAFEHVDEEVEGSSGEHARL